MKDNCIDKMCSLNDLLNSLLFVCTMIIAQKAVDKLDEDTITRKSHTIVDELTNNKDFKVCVHVLSEMCMKSAFVCVVNQRCN